MKRKNNYEQPETVVTRVELESPICSGSVDMTAESPHGVNIEAQQVDATFEKENDFVSNGATWE